MVLREVNVDGNKIWRVLMGKKVVFFVLALLIIVSTSIFAESKSHADDSIENETVVSADNVISANVWPYLAAFFNLGYERKLMDGLSVRVRGEYWGLSQNHWSLSGVGADVFFYPAGKALKGWYLGPRFDDCIFAYSDSGTSGNEMFYFVGGQAGYRWVYENGFEMALSLGALKNIAASVSLNGTDMPKEPPLKDIMLPTFDFDLGYAF
jgi:hypothetical protein